MRPLARALATLTVVLATVAGPLAALAPSARASVTAASSHPLAISITGMTPTTAGPDSTVQVTGTLTNRTGAALPPITVQAMTSTQFFGYPAQMTDFSNGTTTPTAPQLQLAGLQFQQQNALPNGATARWSVSFQAGAFYGQFGVYPIQVQAQTPSGAEQAVARTFLPFWPGSGAASRPKGLQVAWVWPLADMPQQGACSQTLATSGLAGSLASGGRLSTLLDAGSTWAQRDGLTWDLDPALLSDVSVMTKPYFLQGEADCTDRAREKSSAAARTWLSQLASSTASGSAFLMPYANVDVAALSHSGLDTGPTGTLQAAYRLGDTVAGQILPNTFGKTGTGTGSGQVLKAAWPTNGSADAGVLTSLANDGGIGTVVLSSDELSPSGPGGGEDALARTVSGVGTNMSVLVANSRITSLLGTASAAPTQASQFALTQDFLAQTAMIAVEDGSERSLVIAPPPTWDPSSAEANALLSDTQAPWLHPTGLSALAAKAAKLPAASRITPKQVSKAELSDPYTDRLSSVAENASLFENLLFKPPPAQLNSLEAAVAVTESADWRGSGSFGGWRAIGQLTSYLNDAEKKVRLVASSKVLLTGQSGKTAVSVENGLGQPIQVQVTASTPAGSNLQVGPFNGLIMVQAGGTNTVTIPVRSTAIGTTTVQLKLTTRTGTPLTWLGTAKPLSVEVTQIGRFLLIVIGGALGILVLTSAYRLRRKRLADAKDNGTAKEPAEAGGTG